VEQEIVVRGRGRKKKKQYVRKGKTEQENIVAINVVSLYNNDATTMQQRCNNDPTTINNVPDRPCLDSTGRRSTIDAPLLR
jgi:hypothetical protein